jgi:uncharacterized protein (TIGR01244 family)
MIRRKVKLSNVVTIGPAPTKRDLEEVAKDGFTTVVNLSRDGELGQHLSPEEEQSLVEELGLQYIHHPVSMSSMGTRHAEEFLECVANVEGPIFIHCNMGQRCVPFGLVYYGSKRGLSYEEVIKKSSKHGIELNVPSLQTFVKSSLNKFSGELAA